MSILNCHIQEWIQGDSAGGAHPPPEVTCGFLIQLVFTSSHQSVTPFLSGARPPKKNPRFAPDIFCPCSSCSKLLDMQLYIQKALVIYYLGISSLLIIEFLNGEVEKHLFCFSYFVDGVVLIEPDYVKDGKKGKDVSNTVCRITGTCSLCGLI